MDKSVADLINNIDSGTLADAEEIFKNIMDVRAGNALDVYRQQIANNIFNDAEEDYEEFESDDEDHFESEDLGDEDAEI